MIKSIPDNKFLRQVLYWLVTIAAVIVATAQFIYRAWVENDIGAKIGTSINKTAKVLNQISATIIEETEWCL